MRSRTLLAAALFVAAGVGALNLSARTRYAPTRGATSAHADAADPVRPARARLGAEERRARLDRSEHEIRDAALDRLTPAEEDLLADTWAAATATLRLQARQTVADEVMDRRVRELVRRGLPLEQIRGEMEARYRDLYQQIVEAGVSDAELADVYAALGEAARDFEPTPGDRLLDAELRAALGLDDPGMED